MTTLRPEWQVNYWRDRALGAEAHASELRRAGICRACWHRGGWALGCPRCHGTALEPHKAFYPMDRPEWQTPKIYREEEK